jgi:hypothetical protein
MIPTLAKTPRKASNINILIAKARNPTNPMTTFNNVITSAIKTTRLPKIEADLRNIITPDQFGLLSRYLSNCRFANGPKNRATIDNHSHYTAAG